MIYLIDKKVSHNYYSIIACEQLDVFHEENEKNSFSLQVAVC